MEIWRSFEYMFSDYDDWVKLRELCSVLELCLVNGKTLFGCSFKVGKVIDMKISFAFGGTI